MSNPLTSAVRIRLLFGDEIAMGPGKAELLDAIRDSGSISAAAKMLGMSYRRAWLLVETMNACFEKPLVEAMKGGSGGGGARITETGLAVLAEFHELQLEVDRLVASRESVFSRYLRKPRRAARLHG